METTATRAECRGQGRVEVGRLGDDREVAAEMTGRVATVILWRPVGPAELELVRESGWRAWPPRLPDQPIFYPVLNVDYAIKIARDWNVPAHGSGYVTRFELDAEFSRRYPVQQAGGRTIRELWVPAEELAEFNAHIVGPITVVCEFHKGGFSGFAERLLNVAAGGGPSGEVLGMLSVARPKTWIGLDRELRDAGPYYSWGGRWRQIVRAARQAADPLAVMAVACSPDGHERQMALAGPMVRTDRRLLPVLVIRTADWVEPVRQEARQALAAALEAADTAGLVTATGVALELRDWARGDYAVAAVAEALRTAPSETLATALACDDIQVRRLAYRLWTQPDRADDEALVEAALTETDIICRTLCAQAAVGRAVHAGRAEVLERLLAGRSPQVRVEALTGLVKIGCFDAGAAFLTDRSAMLRATAQWAVRRSGKDPAELYRAMLTSDEEAVPVRGLVAGLGECGGVGDVDLIAEFLEHDRPRVRAEAVRAVRRLGGTLPRIAGMLTDPAPVVVRAVTAALRSQPDPVPASRLWELLDDDQPRHVRIGAFNQLLARDTWTRIKADLQLIHSTDIELRKRAHVDLTGWLDRGAATTYTTPTSATHEVLGLLVDAAEAALGTDRTRRLRWCLGIDR